MTNSRNQIFSQTCCVRWTATSWITSMVSSSGGGGGALSLCEIHPGSLTILSLQKAASILVRDGDVYRGLS